MQEKIMEFSGDFFVYFFSFSKDHHHLGFRSATTQSLYPKIPLRTSLPSEVSDSRDASL